VRPTWGLCEPACEQTTAADVSLRACGAAEWSGGALVLSSSALHLHLLVRDAKIVYARLLLVFMCTSCVGEAVRSARLLRRRGREECTSLAAERP